MLAPESWQGWKDSNLRMPESKSGALGQLGYTPVIRRVTNTTMTSIDHVDLFLLQQ